MRRPAVEPPLLWPAICTPPDEADAIKDLHASLYGVTYHVESWRAALELYKFSKSRPANVDADLARQWTFLACHECVMEIYHLGESMKWIASHKIRPCPSIADSIDHQSLRAARKALNEEFPGIENLRDATAHRGSIGLNPTKHAPDGRFGLTGFREPDRFSAPYEGVLSHLDITDASLKKLEQIASTFMNGFASAARRLEQLGHAD